MLLRHCARCLHVLAEIVVGCALLVLVAAGALAWKLSQGPVALPWLAHRLEVEVAEQSPDTHLSIGRAALAWEGWTRGVDQPLDIRLENVRATGPQGTPIAAVPRAEVSLSPAALLLGRLVPRAIELDGASLRLLRTADGAVMFDLGTPADTAAPQPAAPVDDAQAPDEGAPRLPDLLAELARPMQSDRSAGRHDLFGQLRRLRVRDARVIVVDRILHATWSAPQAEIALERRRDGGLAGLASAELELGPARAHLALQAALNEDGAVSLRGQLGPVAASTLARAAEPLAPLKNLDARLRLEITAALSPALAPRDWSFSAEMGEASVHVAQGDVKLRRATLQVEGAGELPGAARLDAVLAATGGDPHVTASAIMGRSDGRWQAQLQANVDRVSFADLPGLWPDGTDHGARRWVIENIPVGIAHDGHLSATLQASDLQNPQLTALSGQVQGQDLQVYWLRPVPSIQGASATLTLDGLDSLTIRNITGQTGKLALSGGMVRITGLAAPHQVARIDGTIEGPLADAVVLLHHPRLHLFEHAPLDLHDPAGTATTRLSVTLPLEDTVTIDDVGIVAQSAMHGVHLGALVAGRDLNNGELDLRVDNNGLAVKGSAALQGIPASLTASVDFRNGPPTQVLEQASVTARASGGQLAAAGLDTDGLIDGTADLKADWRQQRNGRGALNVQAGLQNAALHVEPLGWEKPAGTPATASAVLRLDHDRLAGIDSVVAEGEGLSVRGHAEFPVAGPGTLVLDQATLGRTRMRGSIQLPGRGAPWRVVLSGSQLDLSARLSHGGPSEQKDAAKAVVAKSTADGPPWTLEARFDRALLARGRPISTLVAQAASDGRALTRAHMQAGQPVALTVDITPGQGGRQLALQSPDAGLVLGALDIADDIEGGTLAVQARFDDTRPSRPLEGTATVDNFRVNDAPAMARLLQAMTLYGMVELMRGPGLGFTRLIAPFGLDGDVLELHDARAFSQSLGLTAKGRIDLARQQMDLQGTIVPAYFFNSLLGGLPLVGKLFSPEQGGGVFAATYRLGGSFKDPSVSINPLAALTPGFLRGIFGNL